MCVSCAIVSLSIEHFVYVMKNGKCWTIHRIYDWFGESMLLSVSSAAFSHFQKIDVTYYRRRCSLFVYDVAATVVYLFIMSLKLISTSTEKCWKSFFVRCTLFFFLEDATKCDKQTLKWKWCDDTLGSSTKLSLFFIGLQKHILCKQKWLQHICYQTCALSM